MASVARLSPVPSRLWEPWINSSTPTASVAWAATAPCRACSSMTGTAHLSVRTAMWWGDTKSYTDLTFNCFNKLTVLFCVFLVKSEGHILLHLKVLLCRFLHLMFFLFLLRIPWRCVPDVERRLQTVCWRRWASVSTPTVSAAAPAPVYLRGRLSSLMTTTTPTVSRITTGDYWLFMPQWFTCQTGVDVSRPNYKITI